MNYSMSGRPNFNGPIPQDNGVDSSDPRQILMDGLTSSSRDPTKSGSASDQMGQLLRSEWEDYINRFAPYDQRLIGLATGNEDNVQAINRARNNVAGSFDVAKGTLQRNSERVGAPIAADINQSLNRQSAGARSLAELNAINKTRLHVQDRDQSIMAGDAAAGLKSGRLTSGQSS